MKRALCFAAVIATCAAQAQAQPEPPPDPVEGENPVGVEPEPPPPVEPEPTPVEPAEPAPAQPAPAQPAPSSEPPPGYGAPANDPMLPPLEPSYGPPPPPPEKPDEGFEMPPWSARIDPFNWLLAGRLGLELEVGLLEFLTVELVPTFVVNDKPPTLHLSGAPDVLRQESNGLGPISGGSLDVGLWLDGKAFHGYVIRVGIAHNAYGYSTEDDAGEIDSVDAKETLGFVMFGSQASWGAFTIAGGIGLGVAIGREQRCFPNGATSVTQVQTDNCDDELQIATDRNTIEPVDLHGSLFPVDIIGRFSLGVLFD